MINNLKNTFFQTFSTTLVWMVLVLSIFTDFNYNFNFIWNIIAISLIAGLLFGVMYNAIWNYFTFKPYVNILITSILNISGGLTMLYLFSNELFDYIKPWIIPMIILSLIMHTIIFYFYAKTDSYNKSKELNNLIKEVRN